MIRTVLFDLDGTIVNTNELIIASFQHALQGVLPEEVTREQIISNFGRPLSEQFQIYTAWDNVEDLVLKYRDFNIKMHDELVMEFPYVAEVLVELRRRGIRVGVVTSKIRRTVMLGLKRFGLDVYPEVIVTVDDVSVPKPDPEGIKLAMAALQADPETTLMVGDSQYDILAAKNAGVKSAGVAWTLKGEDFLKQFEPDVILHDMRELLELCESNPNENGTKEG